MSGHARGPAPLDVRRANRVAAFLALLALAAGGSVMLTRLSEGAAERFEQRVTVVEHVDPTWRAT